MSTAELGELASLVDARRVRRAREARGLTQAEVVEAADRVFSAPALSQIERGSTRPSVETLVALARALDVSPRFFVARRGPSGSEDDFEGFFRSLRSTSARDRKRALAHAFLIHDIAEVLEQHVRLPRMTIPEHPVEEDTPLAEIETIARWVRDELDVDDGPVPHMVRVVERSGAVAARFDPKIATVDAFSVPFEDRPVVVLNPEKRNQVRSRFDAAHELGHLVMHRHVSTGGRAIEKQAHRFAAAFLMPADEIEGELPRRAEWQRLMQLKAEWKVSMAALLIRARDLDRMSPSGYVSAMKVMSKRGWRTTEPGDDAMGPPESPVLLEAAVERLEESGSTFEDLLVEAGLPVEDCVRLVYESADPRPKVDVW